MTSTILELTVAHRAAWQAFQDAPADDDHPDTLLASSIEWETMQALLNAIPINGQDLDALESHLDWWVVEEEQRREGEPQLFALHAAIKLARGEGQ